MKPAVHLSFTSALAAVLATSTALAVNPPGRDPELASPPTVDAVSVAISHELPHLELAQAHQEIGHLMAQVHQPAFESKAVAATKGYAAMGHSWPVNQPGKALLLLTRDLDSEAQAQLEEDLSVMSRIIDKAAQSDATSARGPRAMGIELVLGTGSSPARTLYLDGFGAVFMVNVGFPLLPPDAPEDADSDKEKSETETIWEQTRQEMYGGPQPAGSVLAFVGSPDIAPVQPYDEEQVEALRASLIEAVKNANNIRQLTDNESVIIYVTGAPITEDRQVQVWRQTSSSKNEQLAREVVFAHRQAIGDAPKTTHAVMTIQASKADIDRFARGELSLDQFRERVRSHTYVTAATGGWNPQTFLWSNP